MYKAVKQFLGVMIILGRIGRERVTHPRPICYWNWIISLYSQGRGEGEGKNLRDTPTTADF